MYILYLKGHQFKLLYSVCIMFVLVYKADPEEFVAFYLGLHCLPNNLFHGVQNENGSSFSLPYFPRKLKKKIAVCKIVSSLTVYFLIRWLLMNPAVHDKHLFLETFHSGYW